MLILKRLLDHNGNFFILVTISWDFVGKRSRKIVRHLLSWLQHLETCCRMKVTIWISQHTKKMFMKIQDLCFLTKRKFNMYPMLKNNVQKTLDTSQYVVDCFHINSAKYRRKLEAGQVEAWGPGSPLTPNFCRRRDSAAQFRQNLACPPPLHKSWIRTCREQRNKSCLSTNSQWLAGILFTGKQKSYLIINYRNGFIYW